MRPVRRTRDQAGESKGARRSLGQRPVLHRCRQPGLRKTSTRLTVPGESPMAVAVSSGIGSVPAPRIECRTDSSASRAAARHRPEAAPSGIRKDRHPPAGGPREVGVELQGLHVGRTRREDTRYVRSSLRRFTIRRQIPDALSTRRIEPRTRTGSGTDPLSFSHARSRLLPHTPYGGCPLAPPCITVTPARRQRPTKPVLKHAASWPPARVGPGFAFRSLD